MLLLASVPSEAGKAGIPELLLHQMSKDGSARKNGWADHVAGRKDDPLNRAHVQL